MNAVLTREKPSVEIDQRADIGIDGDCPICEPLRDPITGAPPFNDKVKAALKEGRAMMKCSFSSKQYNSREELQQALRKILEE